MFAPSPLRNKLEPRVHYKKEGNSRPEQTEGEILKGLRLRRGTNRAAAAPSSSTRALPLLPFWSGDPADLQPKSALLIIISSISLPRVFLLHTSSNFQSSTGGKEKKKGKRTPPALPISSLRACKTLVVLNTFSSENGPTIPVTDVSSLSSIFLRSGTYRISGPHRERYRKAAGLHSTHHLEPRVPLDAQHHCLGRTIDSISLSVVKQAPISILLPLLQGFPGSGLTCSCDNTASKTSRRNSRDIQRNNTARGARRLSPVQPSDL